MAGDKRSTAPDKEGAVKPAPDLVRFYNDKKVGSIFVYPVGSIFVYPGKLGPGEYADILRSSAEYMIKEKHLACHYEEIKTGDDAHK